MQNVTAVKFYVDNESTYLRVPINFIPRLKKHIKPM